jgi:hypothetical protein
MVQGRLSTEPDQEKTGQINTCYSAINPYPIVGQFPAYPCYDLDG